MYLGHVNRSGLPSAAPNTTSPLPEVRQPGSGGPSAYNAATMAVAVVVGVLLLMVVTAIALTEHRKQKASDALRATVKAKNSENLGRCETRESLGSFDSTAGLKEPEPVARGLSYGRRFAIFCRNQ